MKKLFLRTGGIFVCLLASINTLWAQTKTPEDLVTAILKALESKDEPALRRLAISPDDVKTFVWPAVAARVSGSGMNADKFATNYGKSNDVGIASVLSGMGGRKLQLVKVTMPAPERKTKEYQLFPPPAVIVRDETGQERVIHPVGQILEQSGTYRVATYYVASGNL